MSTTRIAGLVAGLALTTGALAMPFTAAHADPSAEAGKTKPAACSKQATQVERAETALAKVTAVFAKQKSRSAPTSLAEVAKAKKAKKAQQQRLAKAEARLQACTSAQVASS